MTPLFRIELRKPDRNPTYLAVVKGVQAALVGHWIDGKPYAPDKQAIREALPHYYRKAFDRSNGQFWFTEPNNGFAHLSLHPARGRGVLVSIWATPYEAQS